MTEEHDKVDKAVKEAYEHAQDFQENHKADAGIGQLAKIVFREILRYKLV